MVSSWSHNCTFCYFSTWRLFLWSHYFFLPSSWWRENFFLSKSKSSVGIYDVPHPSGLSFWEFKQTILSWYHSGDPCIRLNNHPLTFVQTQPFCGSVISGHAQHAWPNRTCLVITCPCNTMLHFKAFNQN